MKLRTLLLGALLSFAACANATVFDTFDTDATATAGSTFSNGNLTVTGTNATGISASGMVCSAQGQTAGKYYVEVTVNAISGNNDGIGIISSKGGPVNFNGFLGGDTNSNGWGYYENGHVVNGGSTQTAVNNSTYTTNAVIGFAIDEPDATIWWTTNGGTSWVGTSGTPNPATNTGGFSIATSLTDSGIGTTPRLYICLNLSGSSAKFTANFGASAFSGTVPSGFTSGWPNTSAGTYFGTFASNYLSGSGGVAPAASKKTVSKWTSTLTGNLTDVIISYQATGSTNNEACIYADSSGSPGALIAVSTNAIAGTAAYGEVDYTFSGVSVTNGTAYWIGVVTNSTATSSNITVPALINGIAAATNAATYPAADATFGTATLSNGRLNMIAKVSAPVSASFTQVNN